MTTQQCKKCDSTVNTFEKNYMTNKYYNLCNLCRTKCCQTCDKIFPLLHFGSDKKTNIRFNKCRKCREKQDFALCNPCCQTCARTLPLSEYALDKRSNEPYSACIECREKQKQERTQKYYEENKDRINERKRGSETNKAYNKQYREVHKEQISEARNVKFDCGCGGVYSRKNQAANLKSKKHIAWATSQTTPVEI